jgi:transcriptional regulator with XRE-family HTH domain
MPKANGPVIETHRKTRWKRTEFAKRVGCSYSHIYNIERGFMPASEELLIRIARELGVSVDEITAEAAA